MFKKLWDYFSPKYYMTWNFKLPPYNTHLEGSNVYDSKDVAKRVVRLMNKDYGEGTHWVTDEDGNVV